MTTVTWPADAAGVTASGLAEALIARAAEHERWAERNRADGHMSTLAIEAANTSRALADVLAVIGAGSVGLANATARAAYRLMTPDIDHEADAVLARGGP